MYLLVFTASSECTSMELSYYRYVTSLINVLNIWFYNVFFLIYYKYICKRIDSSILL